MKNEGLPTSEGVLPIVFEPATETDAYGLRAVQRDTWLHTYANEDTGITPDDIEWYFNSFKKAFTRESLEKTARDLQEDNPGNRAFVAKENGDVIGYIWAIKDESHNEIGALYVLPSHQGKGVGRGLWNQAHIFFDPRLPTAVTVEARNANAIAFYERLGFGPTHENLPEKLKFPSGAAFSEMRMVRPAEISGEEVPGSPR